jgi:ApaG protein
MISKISEGITISVETYYQPDYSNPVNSEFMFAYRITIENNNAFPVKLLRRHWHIYDSNGSLREVEGEGVVGVQPQINPGESYQYVSGCNLRSEIGKMYGTYLMENINNKKPFDVIIPLIIQQQINRSCSPFKIPYRSLFNFTEYCYNIIILINQCNQIWQKLHSQTATTTFIKA